MIPAHTRNRYRTREGMPKTATGRLTTARKGQDRRIRPSANRATSEVLALH